MPEKPSMAEPQGFVVVFTTAVHLTIADPRVFDRVTGPEGDEFRAQLYDLRAQDDVLEHLAYNCVANDQRDATLLDGWADLPKKAVQMHRLEPFYDVDQVYPDSPHPVKERA
jgi:hypothetical protein